VSAEFDAIIATALNYNPTERFGSAQAMREAVLSLRRKRTGMLAGQASSSPAASGAPPAAATPPAQTAAPSDDPPPPPRPRRPRRGGERGRRRCQAHLEFSLRG